MNKHARPEVVVSKCLGFEACRWNGETVHEDFVDLLGPWVRWHPVCPEVAIGLGVPRDPIRVVEVKGGPRLLQPSTGKDYTKDMLQFSADHLDSLGAVDGFLLKKPLPLLRPPGRENLFQPQAGGQLPTRAGVFSAAR